MTTRTPRRLSMPVVAVGFLFALTALAGCAGLGAEDASELDTEDENAAPNADLKVNRNSAWNDEQFEFDASGSSDADGKVSEYRFDFGDGSEMTVNDADEPKANHIYPRGGEYTATVTVRDDGKDGAGALTDDASVSVAVNDRQPVAIQAVAGSDNDPGPTETNTTQTPGPTAEFEVNDGADKFEVDVEVASLIVAGSSEVTVRVLSPEGDMLAEKTVTVEQDDSESILLTGTLGETGSQGTHTIEVDAESGAASVEGESRVFYDEGFLEQDDSEERDAGDEAPGA